MKKYLAGGLASLLMTALTFALMALSVSYHSVGAQGAAPSGQSFDRGFAE